jgi:hypothetical protein
MLAVSQYVPTTPHVYSISGAPAMTAVDSSNPDLSIQWTTPASGNVLVQLNGCSAAADYGYWGLLTHPGGIQLGYSFFVGPPGGSAAIMASFPITGQTPGTVIQVDWAWTTNDNRGALYLSCEGAVNIPTGTNTGPAVMLVWAAP